MDLALRPFDDSTSYIGAHLLHHALNDKPAVSRVRSCRPTMQNYNIHISGEERKTLASTLAEMAQGLTDRPIASASS